MANLKIRYFVAKPGKAGRSRYFWQPSAKLRAEGWRAQRLPDDADQAIAAARRLNDELDRWRRGEFAEAGRPTPGTVDAVIGSYRADDRFKRLRASTRAGYLSSLKAISAWAGDAPVRSLTPRLVQQFYKSMFKRTPASANATIRVLRLLLEHARREDLIEINPARRPGLFGTTPQRRIWSPEEVAHFVAAADAMGRPSIGDAVMLNEWLGQREGDVIALQRTAYRDGAICLTQSKTGATVEIPVDLVPELKARIEAALARQKARESKAAEAGRRLVAATTLIVSETTGRPYSNYNFRHVFAEVRATSAAGDEELGIAPMPEIADVWFMHLRHTAVTRLAEAGCELPEIASITGHSLAGVEAIVDRYMTRTATMARNAMEKRLAARAAGPRVVALKADQGGDR